VSYVNNSDMAETISRTLAEVGRETFTLFRQVIDEIVSDYIKVNGVLYKADALFAAERDRFKIWAIDLGLLVPGHGSLDYRVREAESLAQTLQTFLIDLNQSLFEVLDRVKNPGWNRSNDTPGDIGKHSGFGGLQDHGVYQDGESDMDDAGGSDAESESDIELLLDSVKDVIDRLYKLSTKIRNPSTRLASSKAQRFRQIDDETGIDLLQTFEHYDYDFVRSIFFRSDSKIPKDAHGERPSAEQSANSQDELWHQKMTSVLCKSRAEAAKAAEGVDVEDSTERPSYDVGGNGTFLIRRIARANGRRRQQFAYWKKHRDKLKRYTQIAVERAGPSPEAAQKVLGARALKEDDSHLERAPSVTTASRLQLKSLNLDDNKPIISVSEYAPSTSGPSKEAVDFPAPPKRVPGKKFFNCPYCFTTCPNDVLSEKAWKYEDSAHL
jgi:hypothetical protein